MSVRLVFKIGVGMAVSSKRIAKGKFLPCKMKTHVIEDLDLMAKNLKEEIDHVSVEKWKEMLEMIEDDMKKVVEVHYEWTQE